MRCAVCSHTVKEIVKVGTVEKDKEYVYCQHRRKETLPGDTLCAIQTQTSNPKRGNLVLRNQESLDPQRNGHFEETENTVHSAA